MSFKDAGEQEAAKVYDFEGNIKIYIPSRPNEFVVLVYDIQLDYLRNIFSMNIKTFDGTKYKPFDLSYNIRGYPNATCEIIFEWDAERVTEDERDDTVNPEIEDPAERLQRRAYKYSTLVYRFKARKENIVAFLLEVASLVKETLSEATIESEDGSTSTVLFGFICETLKESSFFGGRLAEEESFNAVVGIWLTGWIKVLEAFSPGDLIVTDPRLDAGILYNMFKIEESRTGNKRGGIGDLIFGGEFIYNKSKKITSNPMSIAKKNICELLSLYSSHMFCTNLTITELPYPNAFMKIHVQPFTYSVTLTDPNTQQSTVREFWDFFPQNKAANATSLLSSVFAENESTGEVIAVFPGDATYHTMFYTNQHATDSFKRAGLMLAPHHGSLSTSILPSSNDNNTEEVLKYFDTLEPQRIIISAGFKSGDGHPQLKSVHLYTDYCHRHPSIAPLLSSPHWCYYNTTDIGKNVPESNFWLSETHYPIYSSVGAHNINQDRSFWHSGTLVFTQEVVLSLCYQIVFLAYDSCFDKQFELIPQFQDANPREHNRIYGPSQNFNFQPVAHPTGPPSAGAATGIVPPEDNDDFLN